MRKLTVLFAMQYEAGHILSSFRLAKELRSRGHEIVYLSIPNFKETIESQGYRTVSFAEDLLPLDYDKELFSSKRQERRQNGSVYSRYLERITDGTLDSCLKSTGADLLICDPFLSYVAIRASLLGIPAIHLFTSLFLYENKEIPPIISYCRPGSRLRVMLAWKGMFFRFLFVKRLKNFFTGEFRFPTRMQHLVDAYLQVAAKSGYPCKKDKTYRLNEIGLNLILPEIMLCTRSFQFPGDAPRQRMYLGNFVDLAREETDLDPELDDKPIVYCSLGTAASMYPYADHFYQAVQEAGLRQKNWHFVLQISDERAIDKYSSTQNVQVMRWVPQLRLLKNAMVMVTHGGLNSIMECVHHEVPMVIVPGLRDQPGNMVRALHHNLALATTMKHVNGDTLVALIARAVKSERIRSGLQAMKNAIRDEDGLAECISFIETYPDSVTEAAQKRQHRAARVSVHES